MNRKLIVFLCLFMSYCLVAMAQKPNLHKITEENVTFGIPSGWIASKTGKKLGDFGKYLAFHYSLASVVGAPVVPEFSVTDWVSVVDSVLADSVAAGSVV